MPTQKPATLKKGKTPISYYGGKQSLLNQILPLIPKHDIYVEPFFGGGAVYWAKEPVGCEVINDVNANVINFYKVLQSQFEPLQKALETTLHSRATYKKALYIYECPRLFDDFPVVRARAFFIVCNQGFATRIGSRGYSRSKAKHTFQRKIANFKAHLTERLQTTQIENNEAHKVMLSRDTETTFHYVDPPYINSHQGHYGGYEEIHFKRDLDVLASLKGKFLLSSYPSELLDEYIKKHGRYTKRIDKPLSANGSYKGKTRKRKVEVLTANYPI